ncbi:TetR/AcrR family transcriptional regulator [Arthrobacter sp. BE255]|uniref:TetR/AcrR family transcriptional regulator n=1 Tax=Arthrobacter sp. BE255 TaxID=2817721 RepID=UPI0028581E16|nr:TetR/AcrR family transcriptional regulator [Arthrobacter sp. BE255]MDR7159733.1 AcrR family transcriptional regulator [Arthrobacter sp. BE255]
MARPRNQTERRDQLVAAAGRVLLDRGSSAARLSDIANEAGVTPAAVLYYYRDVDELFSEVFHQGVTEYCDRREARIRAESDPEAQLRACIHSGVPWPGESETASRILVELIPVYLRNEAAARQQMAFVERQTNLYKGILERGVQEDTFTLSAPTGFLARSFVALEDGLVMDVLLGDLTPEDEYQFLITYATNMVKTKTGSNLHLS